MWRLAMMAIAAAAIAGLSLSAHDASAEIAAEKIAVSCGGAIQNCPQGKKAYCNRWKACKGKNAKVKRYCDQPVCMTERTSKE